MNLIPTYHIATYASIQHTETQNVSEGRAVQKHQRLCEELANNEGELTHTGGDGHGATITKRRDHICVSSLRRLKTTSSVS